MVVIYFSGTGNTQYLARAFGEKMKSKAYSIEEDVDFDVLINENKLITFAYPIYGGLVPRIMREFIYKHIVALKGKNLIVFCTQYMFSGDGARAFSDLFPKNYVKIVYGEHFAMPNNICNMDILKVTNGSDNQKYIDKTQTKLEKVCKDIRENNSLKRGFNPVSKVMGMSQSILFKKTEKQMRNSAKVDKDCNGCGICTKLCPMNNLSLETGKIVQHDNCTLCYRCVNKCPQKAITVLLDKKPKLQYRGLV